MKKIKMLIAGSGRHGKDTVAEMLRDNFGYTFKSSSMAAARIFLYDKLKGKYGYKDFNECFEDRMNRRTEWYEEIKEYNRDDKARLAKEIMKDSDIYVGMRDNQEIQECIKQGVFELVVGVLDPRKPTEDKSSFNIDIFEVSDIIIMNSGTLEDLERRVVTVFS